MTLQDYINTIGVRIVDASGGTLTSSDIVDFLNEEIRRTRRDIELETGRYISPITLYKGIYRYALPSGYEDFAAITKQGQVPDDLDFVRLQKEEEFWRGYTNRNTFCEARDGIERYALINFVNPSIGHATVDDCESFDGNGTWVADTATSDAATVRTDNNFPFEDNGSVAFDIITGQSVNNYAFISKSDLTAVDLSEDGLSKSGTMTMEVFLPSGVTWSSITLRWGSSSSAYYTSTVTEQLDGTPLTAGTKNVLGFDWVTASQSPVGTPDDSAINYLAFQINFPSTVTGTVYGVRIDNIVMRQKYIADLHYYSGLIVVDGTTGLPKASFDDNADTTSYFSVDDEYVDILTYGALETVFNSYKIDPRASEVNAIRRREALLSYQEKFPSQRVIPVTNSAENPPLVERGWWD